MHTMHRGLLSRVFTPRKMNALEPKIREFCAAQPRPARRRRPVRLRRRPRRADADAGDRHAARHPRAGPGGDPRPRRRDAAHRSRASRMTSSSTRSSSGEMFADYIDWRAEHPSDDLMTELLHAEFEDETGTTRRLTRDEILTYVTVVAGAGNETTTRLIGWAGKVLAEHPDQRRELVDDPLADPERDRGAAALRAARRRTSAATSPATSSATARRCPEGSVDAVPRRRRRTATTAASRTATGSTSTARSASTSRSATASTSASARRSPGSKAASRSKRC